MPPQAMARLFPVPHPSPLGGQPGSSLRMCTIFYLAQNRMPAHWAVFIKQLVLRMVEIIRRTFCIFFKLAGGKSIGDSRFSGARGCSHLEVTKWRNHSRSGSFLLLRSNEAPQDARYSRQESIEVRPLVPKRFSTARWIVVYRMAIFLFVILAKSSLSIHSSTKPQLQHIYLFTFTVSNALVLMLFLTPYASNLTISVDWHFGHAFLIFIKIPSSNSYLSRSFAK